MRIGIDISPLKTAHQFRGTGTYTASLTKSLQKYDSRNSYQFFQKNNPLPQNLNLVHYPYFEPFFLTLPLRKKYPTVVTIHDLIPLVFPDHFPSGIKGKFKWQIQKWSLKQVAAVIVDSECSKQDVIKLTGFPKENIFVVYLAADEEFKQVTDKREKLLTIKKKYNLPEKFVLYVGDATWNKNLPGLIRAIRAINVSLVLVGKQLTNSNFDRSNPWNKDLLEIEKLTEKDRRVLKLGFVSQEDLVGIYNLATLCAQTSFYEGFGLPVLEAMTCGCPVVTSEISSLPEVAQDAAFYVDPEDISSIANGIGEIYFNTDVQEKFRVKGLSQSRKFSWEKTAQETIAVYEKVLSSP